MWTTGWWSCRIERWTVSLMRLSVMHKVIIVVAIPVLLIATILVLTMNGVGQSESESVAPNLAASERFQPGDTAVLMADRVDLCLGDKTVARLGRECRLAVRQVRGSWVGGTVQSGGKTLSGWVHQRYLKLRPRDSANQGAGAVEAPQTGDETLGQEFARLLNEERGAKSAAAAPVESADEPPGAVSPGANAAESLAPAPPIGVRVAVASNPTDLDDLKSLKLIEHLVITGYQFSNRSLRHLEGLRILSLSVEAVNVGNAGLLPVSKVKNLRRLRLWTPGVDDAGLEFVAKLNDLEWLDLEGTSVQGTGLVRLQGLPRLSHLTLGPKTQDDDLAALREFSHLAELDLRSCSRLTEACLASVAKSATLRVVWLPNHLVIGHEDTIRQALPNCEVRL